MINDNDPITSGRRRFLLALGATSVAGCASPPSQANTDAAAGRTPGETEGPFYPLSWDGDVDENLVVLDDRQPYSLGIAMRLTGQVLRSDGSPAIGARVAIWQANHEGRYRHPDDAGEKPAQDGFQGYGQTRTDARGQYQFLTIKPTAYGSRPPHVHFRIDDGNQRLTTQMYFPGETKEGGMLGRMAASLWASDRSLLTAKIAETDNGLDAVFNLRL